MANNTVKVHYDNDTKIVKSYYPYFLNYSIVPTPFIVISEQSWKNSLGKKMIVDEQNQTISEYQENDNEVIEKLKKKLISERKSYLSSTDWYIAREIDIPNSYPEAVKIKRARARIEQEQIADAETLQALEVYNINF